MYKQFKTLAGTLILGAMLPVTAMAGPLSEYNLILLEDYNFQGGDVEGRTFIGGDLNSGGAAVDFASRVPASPLTDSVKVVGDINTGDIKIQNGNLVYGGNNNASNVIFNGTGSEIYNPALSIDSVAAELYSQTSSYAGLSANGTFDAGAATLNYTGSDSLAVFNVDGDSLFAQNNSLKLNYGSAEQVIINVSGEHINQSSLTGGGVNLTDGFRSHELGFGNILWNFFEAQTIDFKNLAMSGSVLAPYAVTTGGAQFDGAFAASSYTGAREFHNFLWNDPGVSVTEPGVLSMLMAGLGILALARCRRRRA